MDTLPSITTDISLALKLTTQSCSSRKKNETDAYETLDDRVHRLYTLRHTTELTNSQVTLCTCIVHVFMTHSYPISFIPPIFLMGF